MPANFVGSGCFCCEAGQPASVAVCFEACAGRRVRRPCPPAVALFSGLCACSPLPYPLPSSTFLPPFILFPPCSFHVRQDRRVKFVVQATCLQAARLSHWQLQHGPAEAARAPVHLLTFPASFSCRVHDPGPWVRANNKVKLYCVVNECAPPACLCFSAGNVDKLSE